MENTDKLTDLIFVLSRITRDGVENKNSTLSYIQFQALSFLMKQENPTMKELSEYIHIAAPSTTALVDNLVRLEYISRTADKEDRRLVRLKITKNGQQELKKGLIAAKKRLEKVLNKLSKKDQSDLINILTKLSKLFN